MNLGVKKLDKCCPDTPGQYTNHSCAPYRVGVKGVKTFKKLKETERDRIVLLPPSMHLLIFLAHKGASICQETPKL